MLSLIRSHLGRDHRATDLHGQSFRVAGGPGSRASGQVRGLGHKHPPKSKALGLNLPLVSLEERSDKPPSHRICVHSYAGGEVQAESPLGVGGIPAAGGGGGLEPAEGILARWRCT